MALTKIRGSQIQDHTIGNSNIDPTSPIVYSNLDLSSSIVATDLSADHTVHTDVLDYKLIALWDLVQSLAVSGTTVNPTAQVQAAAVTDTATNDGSAKGVLTTGTGTSGAGIENYKVQIRDALTKDPVNDGIGGSAYGELTYSSSSYALNFKKSDGSSFSMGAQESTSITTTANTSGVLHNKYFVIASPTTLYALRFIYSGETPTSISGYTNVNVTIALNDSAETVATALAGALNGISGGAVFTASASGAVVTVITVAGAVIQGVSDGAGTLETEFTFAINTVGTPASIDFMFEEIYSLNSAPLKGFVTGTGFTDVESITGTHNHNDLYYTKSELESGQLDDRYYTQGELNAGQLDNRYFTESELLNGAVDSRYYTESEIGSTADGSSGASKVGISGITNLSAGTVQGALAEIQSDIDSIESGALDIQHSLDDAYNDGSAVAVDNTDVDWTLSAGKAFKVVDGSDASKFVVSAGTAADSIKIDTVGGVDIDTNSGLTVDDDSGAYMHIDSTGAAGLASSGSASLALGIDGSATLTSTSKAVELNAVSNADAASVLINSATGGITETAGTSINLTAGTNVNLKDQYLAAALPLSQSNATALSSKFAYNSQTGFNWTTRSTGTDAVTSLVGAVDANRQDLYEYVELLATEGGAVGTAVGANLVGVDGITGVIPTGKAVGANSNLQEMLEGIALGAGGGKTYDTLSAFTTAKTGGTYFKLNEPVFILDTNQWVIVKVQGTAVVEGTDWDYVAGDNRVLGGADFKASVSDDISLTAGDALTLAGTGSAALTGNGASLSLNQTATLAAKAGSAATLSSDTKAQISGGALVDIAGTAVTIEGATAITAPVNAAITETTTGTGQITLASEQGINANGGNIALTSGTGKQVTLTSDTKVTAASGTEVDINGGLVNILAGTGKKVVATSDTEIDINGGANTTITSTAIDLNGALTHSGSNATFIENGNFAVNATGFAAMTADDGGSQIVAKAHDAKTSVDGMYIDVNGSTPAINIYANGNSGLSPVNVTASTTTLTSNVAVNGILTATAPADDDITLTTTGTGQVIINSQKELNVNAPYTSLAGDVTMPVDSWLSAGNIKITSVDPTDEATITGSRTGTVNTLNKLTNSGFESGTGDVADSWSLGADAKRTQVDRYYGSYSIKFTSAALTADEAILTQALTGLTASTAHTVSFYIFGSTGGSLKVSLNGGAAKVIDTAKTYSSWTRVSVTLDADNAAAGNFVVTAAGTGAEAYTCYIDAVMVEEGSTAHDYFTDYQSELVMTIGDNDDDRMVFRSVGTATKDLVRINQTNVEVLGNLVVSGTTTQVSSETVNISDNTLTLNSNVTGTPSLDAFLKVNRGTSAATAIRWNESSDEWEITNDGTNYSAIVTASGSGGLGLSLDTAYDGGSSIAVDNTDLSFVLAASKNFIVSDATDSNKFEISAGSGDSSVKIETSGGVSITGSGLTYNYFKNSYGYGVRLYGNEAILGSWGNGPVVKANSGGILIASLEASQPVEIRNDKDTSDASVYVHTTLGGIDINAAATKPITMDSGSFSIDGVLASNIDVTGANLTVGTLTSGDLLLSSAGDITGTAGTDKAISFTASGTGKASLVSAQEVDLTGGDIVLASGTGKQITETSDTAINLNGGATVALTATILDLNGQMDFDGGTFDVNATGTTASAVKIVSAGGVDVDAAGTISLTSGTESVSVSSTYAKIGTSDTNITLVGDSGININTNTTDAVLQIQNNKNSADNAIQVYSSVGGIDINAAATKPITMDSGSFSIDGVLASNVSVTGAALTLSTITSGNVVLSSAGELVFSDSRLAGVDFTDATYKTLPGSATSIVGALNILYNGLQSANTLDEIYDGETGDRIVVMDNGSVDWKITNTYQFALQDSTAANILSAQALASGNIVDIDGTVTVDGPSATFTLTGSGASSLKVDTLGGIDLDTDAGFTLNDDSGASIVITSAGAVALASATNQDANITANGTGNINLVSNTGKIAITSNSAATDSLKLYATNGGVQIESAYNMSTTVTTTGTGSVQLASAQEIDLTGGAIDINGGDSNDITVDTTGSGRLLLTSANRFALTGAAASEIKTTAGNLSVHATGSGSELIVGDARTGDINFSDSTHTALPNGATSLIAAIQAAYDNKGTEVSRAYHEITATATDVSNDYVVTNITLFPTDGTFPMSPSSLRSLSNPVHAVVYLNGLRLSDTEWQYRYDSGSSERRISFDGSNNIVLVAGDIIMVDVEKITSVTA